jgi:hypothetical protein
MSWPFKDYDFYGYRYVNIKDPDSEFGETMWYDRELDHGKTPTECLICIEAENEMYTKYAHPRAHLEAHIEAGKIAEKMAIEKKNTTDYIDYYTIYFSIEYRKIYTTLYKKYKEEYSKIVLSKSFNEDDKICQYHLESIQYHYEHKEVLA